MIKVIDINSYGLEEQKLDNSYIPYYESPILKKFLNEGWTIKDWKMAKSRNGSDWTFILEKEDEDEIKSPYKTPYNEIV